MKQILVVSLLALVVLVKLPSCKVRNRIYYTKNVDKCIHNLNEMQRWLQDDYSNGDIPKHVVNNYMIVIINTKCSLYKKIKEKHVECVD